jgi:hypothetical protein
MKHWARLFALGAALLLTGCLWTPGKFTSELLVRKNGTFVLDYRGEILLQRPDEKAKAEPWADSMARCFEDGRTETLSAPPEKIDSSGEPAPAEEGVRPCTPDEIAQLKADYEQSAQERLAKEQKESEEMAKLFGIPGTDDESNRRFAANLMKYEGWRSVRYKGDGVFDVDYHFEGRTDQDFAFPLMPDSDYVIPFVVIRRRADGAVMVTAPAFAGGGGPFSARARALGLPDKGSGGPTSKAEGRFTVITDGEILTNNSEDGPASHASGRQIQWNVDPNTTRLPETLIRLK